MGLNRFRKSASLVVRVVFAITVFVPGCCRALAQAKPERQSKADQGSEAKPSILRSAESEAKARR